jgi:glucose-fructose oxidoreductase
VKQVRYAVVGLGYISQVALMPAFRNAKNSILAALVSDDPKKLKELAKRYHVDPNSTYSYERFDECLESGKIDAVYIGLPNHLHCDYTVRAARAGVHVLCEKPMAVDEKECERMIMSAEKSAVKLMIAYRLHFEEANLEAVSLAESGKLGELRYFTSSFSQQVVADNVRLAEPESRGGGSVYDMGVYCINAARYLFQDEPIEVTAVAANNGEMRFRGNAEMTSAVLRFPEERLAMFTSSFGAADVSEYCLVGTRGRLRMSPAYDYSIPLQYELTIGEGKPQRKKFAKRDQFGPELSYFSDCVLRDREPEPSGVEGLADVRVVRAILESGKTQRPVKLRPLDRRDRPTKRQQIRKPAIRKPELVHAASPSGD